MQPPEQRQEGGTGNQPGSGQGRSPQQGGNVSEQDKNRQQGGNQDRALHSRIKDLEPGEHGQQADDHAQDVRCDPKVTQ